MSQGVGKKLHDARVQRGLSIEEVAHATKLRPDKIAALEHDDYAHFASNAYAKGFLQIYGRYLDVDTSELCHALNTSSRIAVGDYQYLTNGIQPSREPERATFSFSPKKSVPSIVPLVVFVAMLVLGLMGFQLYVNWQRVTGNTAVGRDRRSADETAAVAKAPLQSQPNAPAAAAASTDAALISRSETMAPQVMSSVPAPAPVAAGPTVNEVQIEPVKKTMVTVRRDDPKSAPVFEDFLYPDARPLKLKGASIYVEARDPSAIVIRKNGAPIAYTPGAEIR